MKRYIIFIACVLMLLALGTNQAWSVFVRPLRSTLGFSAFQMQFIFNTGTFVFCTSIIIAGRLHDKFGPRPLAIASATLVGTAWMLAAVGGEHYLLLWLALGVLASAGSATGYVCPLATAIKWFPNRHGLVSGLTAAGFAGGPVLLSAIAECLLRRGWQVHEVFRLVACAYAPVILFTGMALTLPPGARPHREVAAFSRRALARDRRFWTLFAGMLTGTFPFLVVMGNAKPLALDFGLVPALATLAISVLALSNAAGRIGWGLVLDRIGARPAMAAAQGLSVTALVLLIVLGNRSPVAFFAGLAGIGFCYGSNFAIYPAIVTRLYGAFVLGSVYPFIMSAQAISSFGPAANGYLKDATDSNLPGLILALTVAVAGSVICFVLSRSLQPRAS